MAVRGHYYQQFDADLSLDAPGEGYGGWKTADFDLNPDRTAVVCMHAWDAGTPELYPGWFRAVEYLPRSYQIARTVFPKLFKAVRETGFKLFHVVGEHTYYKDYPGHKFAVKHALPAPPPPPLLERDPVYEKLAAFKGDHTFVGKHNAADVQRGWPKLDFVAEARPVGDEPIAENSEQLAGVCKALGVNHLVYVGFAINWCLFYSDGGMRGMTHYGAMCSVIRDGVTAVENKETARHELNKQSALWRVAMAYGYVFDSDDFIAALRRLRK
jgi:hypothetical protein